MAGSQLRSTGVSGPDVVSPGDRTRPPAGFGAVIGAYLAGNAVAILLISVSGAAVDSPVYNILGLIGLWAGFVGVPIYLSRTRGTGRLATDFGLRFGGPGDVGLGLVAGGIGYGFAELYATAIRGLGDHTDLGHEATRLSGHGLGAGFVAFAVAVALVTPFTEELYFRGLTQPVLQRFLGEFGGVAVTAVLFGFAHLGDNPIEAVFPLAVFGAILGILAWRTGRLGPGIIAHATFNGITVIALAASR